MPFVHTQTRIQNISLEKVWATVCDFSRYPALMEDVLEVTNVPGSNGELTVWRILLNGSEMNWTERDWFYPYERIVFEQTEGDMEVFRGEWRLWQDASDVEVSLEIEFDIGIPSLSEMLDGIGVRAIHSNSRQMLEAIKGSSRDVAQRVRLPVSADCAARPEAAAQAES